MTTSAGLLACENFTFFCDEPDEARIGKLPTRLSETGLYENIGSDALAAGVRAYRPEFQFWSDGAVKRRFVFLPSGEQIDTSNMDDWRFPAGTKFWKEFSLDSSRIETRLYEKFGDKAGDWVSVSYIWKSDGSDAIALPFGAVDVKGTFYNVPAAQECGACHDKRGSRILGFSAIQLSRTADPGQIDLDTLIAEQKLSDPPAARFTIPGNDTERAALGYLHANCGHCHNGHIPRDRGDYCWGPPSSKPDFWLRTSRLDSPQNTLSYQTAVGVDGERFGTIIVPGNPDESQVVKFLASAGGIGNQMPPIGKERVDTAGVELIRRWISEM